MRESSIVLSLCDGVGGGRGFSAAGGGSGVLTCIVIALADRSMVALNYACPCAMGV